MGLACAEQIHEITIDFVGISLIRNVIITNNIELQLWRRDQIILGENNVYFKLFSRDCNRARTLLKKSLQLLKKRFATANAARPTNTAAPGVFVLMLMEVSEDKHQLTENWIYCIHWGFFNHLTLSQNFVLDSRQYDATEVTSFCSKHFINSFESHDRIVFHKTQRNPIKTFLKAYEGVSTKRFFLAIKGGNIVWDSPVIIKEDN